MHKVAQIAVLLLAAFALRCPAQTFPSKPIRFVVPFTAGSASDLFARMLAPRLLDAWGQQIVVDNRPSAGGTVAGGIVAAASPDGHTLLVTSSAFAGSAALYPKLPYDTVKDFAGVTQIASGPLVLVVGPGLSVKSVKELVTLAQQQPGKINYASSGIGSGTHYVGELFRLAAGISVVHVPYRGVPEAFTDVMTQRIHYYLPPILPSMPLIRDGRLLALGVTTRERSPMLPDVPTVAEAGVPGFEYDSWFGVIAPARVPRAVIDRISSEVGRILRTSEIRERFASFGVVPRPGTPAEFDRLIRSEIVTRGKVFKAAGTKIE